MQNETLIRQFYQAFQRGDAQAMAACYHPDIEFEDPAFGRLKGSEVGAMWAMLIDRSKGQLQIEYSDVQADGQKGQAHWEARYVFSQTGRQVHNRINAQFRFKEGKIISHRDHFSFWKWATMALGLPGLLLGWTPFLKNKVRTQARKALSRFQNSK